MVPPKGELKQELRATTAHLNARLLQHSQHSARQTKHADFEQWYNGGGQETAVLVWRWHRWFEAGTVVG